MIKLNWCKKTTTKIILIYLLKGVDKFKRQVLQYKY